MLNVGPAELMLIFILALLVFGPKKLPEVSRQIGRGIREFRRASDDVRGEIEGALSFDDPPEDKPGVSSNGSTPDSAGGSVPAEEGLAGEAPTERTD